MLFVYLRGGFGNQLFQVCFGTRLAIQYDMSMCLVDHYYQPSVQKGVTVRKSYVDSVFRALQPVSWNTVTDRTGAQILALPQSTDQTPFPLKAENMVLNGYFQEWALVEPAIDEFARRLSFTTMQQTCRDLHDYSTCVALHFRYGDYVHKYAHVYHALPFEYYQNAVAHFKAQHPPLTTILLFCQPSDWPAFVEPIVRQLQEAFPSLIFERVVTKSEVEDFLVMSLCPRIAIANSSFSYWAAALSRCVHVVRPNVWYKRKFVSYMDASKICSPNWTTIQV